MRSPWRTLVAGLTLALATAAEWEPWFSFIWDRDFVSASTSRSRFSSVRM